MRQLILDTETTGLEPSQGHRLIEIAAIEMINRRFTGKHFHYYINPERDIEAGAQSVHGITSGFLADKPKFSAICAEFLEFVKGAEVIIHNAVFDVGFINHEIKLFDKSLGEFQQYCEVFDTLPLARQMHPGQRNSLDALCKRYSVDHSDRNLHGALIDAKLLALVYLAMTGGQGTLFSDEVSMPIENARQKKSRKIQTASQPLMVLHANEEELQQHEAYLEKLRKKSQKEVQW